MGLTVVLFAIIWHFWLIGADWEYEQLQIRQRIKSQYVWTDLNEDEIDIEVDTVIVADLMRFIFIIVILKISKTTKNFIVITILFTVVINTITCTNPKHNYLCYEIIIWNNK